MDTAWTKPSLLTRFNREPFFDRFITCDEKWVLYDNNQVLERMRFVLIYFLISTTFFIIIDSFNQTAFYTIDELALLAHFSRFYGSRCRNNKQFEKDLSLKWLLIFITRTTSYRMETGLPLKARPKWAENTPDWHPAPNYLCPGAIWCQFLKAYFEKNIILKKSMLQNRWKGC